VKTEKSAKRKAGRPAKGDAPPYNVEELDRLLVHGDHVELEGGQITVVYPSFRELALRYECSVSTISDYAKAHNTAQRRKAAADHLRVRSDQKLSELRATAVAITRDDEIRIIDTYIAQFEKALAEGRVRCDNIADLNTALRLKQLLMGDADSRSELNVIVSLQTLQARHNESLRRMQVVNAPEAGVETETPESPAPQLSAGTPEVDWMPNHPLEGESLPVPEMVANSTQV